MAVRLKGICSNVLSRSDEIQEHDGCRFNTIIGNYRKEDDGGSDDDDPSGAYNEVVLRQSCQIVPIVLFRAITCDYETHHVYDLHESLQSVLDHHLNNGKLTSIGERLNLYAFDDCKQ